ncbi:LETM1-like protein-domain-containing protein [Syncephalis plumigaleata]|nr:LETM1-like protein-domain-containing protein [Syncephalis plumigaleata]
MLRWPQTGLRAGNYTAFYTRQRVVILTRAYSAATSSKAAPATTSASNNAAESQSSTTSQAVSVAVPFSELSLQVKQGQLANAYSFKPSTGDTEKTMGEKIKFYARHYFNGLKQVFVNRSEASEIRKRISQGHTMTRADYQLMTRASGDVRKMLPFLLVLIVLPESIPFLLLFAPGLVPSTCILPSQLIPASAYCDAVQLQEIAAQYQTDFLIEQLSKDNLTAYCRFLGLSDFGAQYTLQRRLIKYLDYLRRDDELIQREGVDSLSNELLRDAAEERGIRSQQIEPAKLRVELQEWIDLRLGKPAIPPALLVFSQIFRNLSRNPSMPSASYEVAEKV